MQPESPPAPVPACEGAAFEIRVKGHLDEKWSEWLEGLEARLEADGEMVLCGCIVDQAALMGILSKLNRLNLALVSVHQVNPLGKCQASTGDTNAHITTV
jgi:hypothetical protein